MAKAAAEAKTKELVTTDSNANLPTYLKDYQGGSGLVGLDSSDFIIPRIKLLQGVSPELTTHENAKQGIFWLNVIDVPIGSSFDFTPILNRKRYMLMPPLFEGQKGVFARADDGKKWNTLGEWDVKMKGVRGTIKWKITDLDVRASGITEFGTSNPEDPDSNPAATLFYDFLVLIHDQPEITTPVMLSLARSSAKRGKDLQGKIGFGNAPMQARKFRAGVVQEQGGEGPYNNWQFAANGFVPEEFFSKAKSLEADFRGKNFRGADDDEVEGATSGSGEPLSKEF